MWKKLKSWKDKCLSMVGKEVLLKLVVQAIFIYTMSCFKLPLSLCFEIQNLMEKFWWGYDLREKNHTFDSKGEAL